MLMVHRRNELMLQTVTSSWRKSVESHRFLDRSHVDLVMRTKLNPFTAAHKFVGTRHVTFTVKYSNDGFNMQF